MGARRTAGVVTGVVVAVAVAGAITFFNWPDRNDNPSAANTAPVKTADITKVTLIDRENHDGTLGHGDATAVLSRGAGTVTWLPAEGAVLKRGQTLYRLDNRPVVLLYGSLPPYRTLKTGVKGPDVKQFEQNLRALGYRGFTVDSTYDSATTTAVKRWQGTLGLTRTGSVEPGQIEYAAGEVRIDSVSSQVGALVGPGAPVQKVTGTAVMASVTLEMTSARLAKKNAPVQIKLPDGKAVPGKIAKVVTVVAPGESDGSATTKINVTIGFDKPVQSMGSAAVSVAFVASQRKDVLAVPVTALLALAEGGYGIQVVETTGTRIVPVETGLFADGKVEVEGDGLRAGMKVGVPS